MKLKKIVNILGNFVHNGLLCQKFHSHMAGGLKNRAK